MPTLAEQIGSLILPEMTDADRAKYLGLTARQYEKYKTTITPDDLAFIEQARAVETLCPLWQSGAEPYPSDVSVNRGRKSRSSTSPAQAWKE